jgi:hypothetical protein
MIILYKNNLHNEYMLDDSNYYDINGEKICDIHGNRFLINCGNSIYDIETGSEYKETENKNYYITKITKIYEYICKFFIMMFSKCWHFLYKPLKN